VFSDFTAEELLEIISRMLAARNVACSSPDAKAALKKLVSDYCVWLQQGNARSARNLVDNLMRQQSARLVKKDSHCLKQTAEALREITADDISAISQVFQDAHKMKTDLKNFIL